MSIMLLLVALPMVVVLFTVWGGPGRHAEPADLSVATLKVAAVAVLGFLPGWLYVRFLGQRAGALWSEYVLNLHRLRWDESGFLPEPPCSSGFHEEWLADRRERCPDTLKHGDETNIYQQKFDAYYGRSVSEVRHDNDFMVQTDMMFPVFLATAVLATGWTAVLWDDGFATAPTTVWDVLKYAFVGAYIFTIQSLIRRFFQSDLRPSAYASLLVRFIVALSVTIALYQTLSVPTTTAAAVAFVVGIFPAVALQALQRTCAAVLGVVVRPATADYPLSQIDGLDLWYQARLLEEGIEDMQNLATANLVDVMLHSRVPVDRLVDWVDQCHLYLHLDHAETGFKERRAIDSRLRAEREAASRGAPAPDDPASRRVHGSASLLSRAGTRTRIRLRQLGIRTATDLLKVFPDEASVADVGDAAGIDAFQLRMLWRALANEDGLTPVWNWQRRGVPLAGGREPGPDAAAEAA
jgi:hypothetical protein